jgi:hypothetical protein
MLIIHLRTEYKLYYQFFIFTNANKHAETCQRGRRSETCQTGTLSKVQIITILITQKQNFAIQSQIQKFNQNFWEKSIFNRSNFNFKIVCAIHLTVVSTTKYFIILTTMRSQTCAACNRLCTCILLLLLSNYCIQSEADASV